MSLDPDDPRPPYQQVTQDLRAAILTRRLEPGEQLPSGPELAKRYGVSRMTVQQAIRRLKDEGLVVSRQGSGVFVRARTEQPVGLRPHIDRAFESDSIAIDFAGFSGETLAGAITEPLDRVRAGRLAPKSIAIRVLIPDPGVPWALPARADTLTDDPPFRQRMARITDRSLSAISDSLGELQELGLVPGVNVRFRAHGAAPLFKLYIINREEVFFGFYPVRERTLTFGDDTHAVFDLMGKDATLFHHAASDDDTSAGRLYVEQAQNWFDSVWDSVSREYNP